MERPLDGAHLLRNTRTKEQLSSERKKLDELVKLISIPHVKKIVRRRMDCIALEEAKNVEFYSRLVFDVVDDLARQHNLHPSETGKWRSAIDESMRQPLGELDDDFIDKEAKSIVRNIARSLCNILSIALSMLELHEIRVDLAPGFSFVRPNTVGDDVWSKLQSTVNKVWAGLERDHAITVGDAIELASELLRQQLKHDLSLLPCGLAVRHDGDVLVCYQSS